LHKFPAHFGLLQQPKKSVFLRIKTAFSVECSAVISYGGVSQPRRTACHGRYCRGEQNIHQNRF
jgi:hypothetical protein